MRPGDSCRVLGVHRGVQGGDLGDQDLGEGNVREDCEEREHQQVWSEGREQTWAGERELVTACWEEQDCWRSVLGRLRSWGWRRGEEGRQREEWRRLSWSQEKELQAVQSEGDLEQVEHLELSIEVQDLGEVEIQAHRQDRLLEDILPGDSCSGVSVLLVVGSCWRVEDTGPVLQELRCSQDRSGCLEEDLLDLQDRQVQVVRTCPVEELQARRSMVWEEHLVRSCILAGRMVLHQAEEVQEWPRDLGYWPRPCWRAGPDRAGAAGSGGSGWSPPSGRASSGSGVTATEREH